MVITWVQCGPRRAAPPEQPEDVMGADVDDATAERLVKSLDLNGPWEEQEASRSY